LTIYNPTKQREDELYAYYIDEWIRLAHVDEWKAWTSYLLSHDDPQLWVNLDVDLSYLRQWLFNRIWPKRYTDLEDAFENFRRILQDFQNTFHEYSEKAEGLLWTRKFYQIEEWDEDKYERLSRRYIFHVKLIQDLILELTRAANYICDKIRQFIDPSFRLKEGLIIVESGPYMNMSWLTHRVEYRGDERSRIPYPGLEEFKRVRQQRDYCFGAGVSIEDPEFLEWYQSDDER
jgi:hypothetical protein